METWASHALLRSPQRPIKAGPRRSIALARTAAVLAIALLGSAAANNVAGTPAFAESAATKRSAEVQVLIEQYAKGSSKDIGRLKAELLRLGATKVRFTEEPGSQSVTTRQNGAESGSAFPLGLPSDIFSINGLAIHLAASEGAPEEDYLTAWWAFKPTFVAGGDPDDAAGFALGNFDANCYYFPTWSDLPAKGGGNPELMYIKSTDQANIVYGVQDYSSGFVLYPDSGQITAEVRWRSNAGCSRHLVGAGYYEHNQDGSGSWNVQIGLGIGMILQYSSVPLALQKSTPLLNPNPD